MATETAAIIPALREHLALTQVKLYTPEAPEYDDIESCFLVSPNKTSAIARPQTAEDVATLIRFCVANSVKFAVRSGGHDTTARTKVQGALFIDMRDINYVSISVDKTTARVGGGILTSKLAKSLNEQGLVTPW